MRNNSHIDELKKKLFTKQSSGSGTEEKIAREKVRDFFNQAAAESVRHAATGSAAATEAAMKAARDVKAGGGSNKAASRAFTNMQKTFPNAQKNKTTIILTGAVAGNDFMREVADGTGVADAAFSTGAGVAKSELSGVAAKIILRGGKFANPAGIIIDGLLESTLAGEGEDEVVAELRQRQKHKVMSTEEILIKLGIPSDKTDEVINACRRENPNITDEQLISALRESVKTFPETRRNLPNHSSNKASGSKTKPNDKNKQDVNNKTEKTSTINDIATWAGHISANADTLRLIATISDRIIGNNSVVVSKIMETTILVAQGVSAVTTLLQSTAVGSALGPIGTIIGVVYGLVNLLFGAAKGPSSTEIILGRLSQLSNQIDNLQRSMDQHFRDNMDMQLTILTVLQTGLNGLMWEVKGQMSSLRADMNARLDEIKALVNGTTVLLDAGQRAATAFDLNDLCAEVEQWMDETAPGKASKEIPKLSSALARWIETHSSNPVFNGTNVIALNQSSIAAHILDSKKSDNALLIDNIAYFANVYQKHGGEREIIPRELPNIEIWHKSIESYGKLKLDDRFIEHDIPNWKKEVTKLRVAGKKIANFAEAVDTDREFWEVMLEKYHILLQKLNDAKDEYVTKAQTDIANDLATRFNTRRNPRDNEQAALGVGSLDFFKHPNEAVKLFASRRIGTLVGGFKGDITKGFQYIAGAPGRSDTIDEAKEIREINNNLTPWYRKGLISSHHLLAEYLELIQFTGQLKDGEPLARPMVFSKFDYGELCHLTGLIERRNGRQLQRDGNVIKDIIGSEFFIRPWGTTHWEMNVILNVVRSGSMIQNMPFSFRGSYDGLRVNAHIQISWNNEKKEHEWVQCANDNNAFNNRVRAIIPAYVSQQWQNADQNLAAEKIHPLDTTSISAFIDNEFLRVRRTIANDLDIATSEKNQAEMNKYSTALNDLDLHVKQMQLFLHLAGRDITHPTINALISSLNIKSDLIAFQVKGIKDTDLLPSVTDALKNKLELKTLFEIPHIDISENPNHPMSLHRHGSAILDIYESKKTLSNLEFKVKSKSSSEWHKTTERHKTTSESDNTSCSFMIKNMLADGNCLFHAIADQLMSLPLVHRRYISHTELRQNAVNFIRDHRQAYANFITGDMAEYLNEMARNGVWAGENEIRALAEVLRVCIHVMQGGSSLPPYGDERDPSIYLFYNGTNHYDSLILLNQTPGHMKNDSATAKPSNNTSMPQGNVSRSTDKAANKPNKTTKPEKVAGNQTNSSASSPPQKVKPVVTNKTGEKNANNETSTTSKVLDPETLSFDARVRFFKSKQTTPSNMGANQSSDQAQNMNSSYRL